MNSLNVYVHCSHRSFRHGFNFFLHVFLNVPGHFRDLDSVFHDDVYVDADAILTLVHFDTLVKRILSKEIFG